jgi:hypothetical protein
VRTVTFPAPSTVHVTVEGAHWVNLATMQPQANDVGVDAHADGIGAHE